MIWLVAGIACMPVFAMAAIAVYTIPSVVRLSPDEIAPATWPSTIDEAVEACADSGLQGWELVARGQRIVSERFRYSRRNPWDSPHRAFKRGLGYCLQQARALKAIYDRLGIDSRIVMATCHFPGKMVHGVPEPPMDGKHAWLRITMCGETKDVCPGNAANVPGSTHFTILTAVRPLRSWMIPFAHLGSVVLNTRRDRG